LSKRKFFVSVVGETSFLVIYKNYHRTNIIGNGDSAHICLELSNNNCVMVSECFVKDNKNLGKLKAPFCSQINETTTSLSEANIYSFFSFIGKKDNGTACFGLLFLSLVTHIYIVQGGKQKRNGNAINLCLSASMMK